MEGAFLQKCALLYLKKKIEFVKIFGEGRGYISNKKGPGIPRNVKMLP
jgi:hypothetical protein